MRVCRENVPSPFLPRDAGTPGSERMAPPRLFPSSIHKLRENVFQEHQTLKEKELETGPRASHGYGGKFGVEQDRMDKVSARPRRGQTFSWAGELGVRSGNKMGQGLTSPVTCASFLEAFLGF